MELVGAAVTDKGIKKNINQDSVAIKVARTSNGTAAMIILCDGMGGLSKGEMASVTVLLEFSDWFEQRFPKLMQNNIGNQRIKNEWKRMVQNLNEQIKSYGERKGIKLGTTLTAMLLYDTKFCIVHVGDTRAYKINDTSIKMLTKDHTFIAQEIEEGRMTEEQAKTDSRKNMLLQCIGASEYVEPEFHEGDIEDDSVYMICSDGFRHEISEDEIIAYLKPAELQNSEKARTQIKKLININKRRKEKDNISAVVIRKV